MKKRLLSILFLFLLFPLVYGLEAEMSYTLDEDNRCVDTGLYVYRGDSLYITATGSMDFNNSGIEYGPKGKAFYDSGDEFDIKAPCENIYNYAVVGKIGGNCFYIGSELGKYSFYEGKLTLCINEYDVSDNEGKYTVKVSEPDLTTMIIEKIEWPVNRSKECMDDSDCDEGYCNHEFVCVECYNDEQCNSSYSEEKFCRDDDVYIKKINYNGYCNIRNFCDMHEKEEIVKYQDCDECLNGECVDVKDDVIEEEQIVENITLKRDIDEVPEDLSLDIIKLPEKRFEMNYTYVLGIIVFIVFLFVMKIRFR